MTGEGPLRATEVLPEDAERALLIGRLQLGGPLDGPRPVLYRDGALIDLSPVALTVSQLLELEELPARLRGWSGKVLGSLDDALADGALLAPCDLQAIKAAGVTFADSLMERLIEEAAGGAADVAGVRRDGLQQSLGESLRGVTPGTPGADRARRMLTGQGLWSQYLEVAIGPDPEIFTKAQPMSAVGCGAAIGVRRDSSWSCSEPELVLAIASDGRIVGATLGNDLSLRDLEGRSALLLGQAKDNNASCAMGPFIRLLDDDYHMPQVRNAVVSLVIDGADGYHLAGTNRLDLISRDVVSLVAAATGDHHQYPDGLMLFLGTMFVPNADRGGPGRGFSHQLGDRVGISSPELGALINRVTTADQAPPWTFGTGALLASLLRRAGIVGDQP